MMIGRTIKLIFSGIWDFLSPFINIFLAESGKILASVALEAVTRIANDPKIISNDEKRKTAFKDIVQKLKAKGVELSESVINAAIEAAVQKLKAG